MGLPPNETVYKIISLPRWQREWVNSHRSINFSGMVQEMLAEVIRQNDPEYITKQITTNNMRRKEETLIYLRASSKNLF